VHRSRRLQHNADIRDVYSLHGYQYEYFELDTGYREFFFFNLAWKRCFSRSLMALNTHLRFQCLSRLFDDKIYQERREAFLVSAASNMALSILIKNVARKRDYSMVKRMLQSTLSLEFRSCTRL
jgi:hypothetical protein